MHFPLIITMLFGFLTPADTVAEAFVAWAKESAVAIKPGSGFEGLAPIGKMIGDAEVICLGESRHDIHEQFLFKHRLIEYLVMELGFSVITLEEGLPYSRKINRYVLGGEGDPHELLNGMGAWFAWDTEEMLEIIEWMRQINADPERKRKVRFYGFDVTAPLLGLKNTLTYLEKVDPGFAESIQKKPLGLDLFDDLFWPRAMERFEALSVEERDVLADSYKELIGRMGERRPEYIEATSEKEYEWALREAMVASAGNDVFSSGSREVGGSIRDAAMADNFMWLRKKIAPGERIIVWAHNAHVCKTVFTMPPMFPRHLTSMGYHLTEKLSDKLFVVGATFNSGEYTGPAPPGDRVFGPADPEYLDGALARVGLPVFILDLRAAPGPAGQWLAGERGQRSQDMDMVCRPGKMYDAVFFVDRITRTKANPLSLKRYREMR